MFEQMTERFRARSAALSIKINDRLDLILKCWLLGAGIASVARIGSVHYTVPVAGFSTFASYMLLIVAPFASTLLALHWFRNGDTQRQPVTRLARVGSWRSMSEGEAKRHSLYGTSGIMVSLLVGMMLNVPLRAAEYLAAMPPIPVAPPQWLSALHFAMTFDAVVFSSLYMIAFVAALRRVPLFPRLLVAIWLGDLAMQLFTAELVTRSGDLPQGVAEALQNLLTGNVKKALISIGLWLPYLLLSKRVNVTYRHRVPA
jgi:hypothetical protein